MSYVWLGVTFIFSYLLGTIPTGFIVVKLITGKDLRTVGSGNLGGTNASRAGEGKGQKNLIYFTTGIIDLLKGAIPVIISISIFKTSYCPLNKDMVYTITALLSIIGHDTMPFIKSGRGKGVATTAGAFLPIAAVPIMLGTITFIVLRLFTSTASKRSIAALIIAATSVLIMNYPIAAKYGLVVATILIIITHRENIVRIIDGRE